MTLLAASAAAFVMALPLGSIPDAVDDRIEDQDYLDPPALGVVTAQCLNDPNFAPDAPHFPHTVQLPETAALTPDSGDGRQTVFEAGTQLPAAYCSDDTAGSPYLLDGDTIYKSNSETALVPVWTDSELESLLATTETGQVAGPGGDLLLHSHKATDEPIPGSGYGFLLDYGTGLDIGPSVFHGAGHEGSMTGTGYFHPVRTSTGHIGWLSADVITTTIAPDDVTFEAVTLGLGALAVAAAEPDPGEDFDPDDSDGRTLLTLQAGDEVQLSSTIWETSEPLLPPPPDLDEDLAHLTNSARMIRLDSGVVGWVPAWVGVPDQPTASGAEPSTAPAPTEQDGAPGTADNDRSQATSPAEASGDSPDAATDPEQESNGATSSGWIIAGMAAIIVLLLAVVLGLALRGRRRDSPPPPTTE